jgi:hypothetical protein
MSLATRVTDLATRTASEAKALRTLINGNVADLSALQTTAKSSLVAAINELKASGAAGDPWSYSWIASAVTAPTTTAVDVHTGFTPSANTRYIVDALLMVTSAAATTGVQTALLGPSTGITRVAVKIVSAATVTTDKIDHISALNTYQVATAGLTTPSLIYLQAVVDVGASPGAGTIKVAFKSEVASSAVVVQPGSSIRWRVAA